MIPYRLPSLHLTLMKTSLTGRESLVQFAWSRSIRRRGRSRCYFPANTLCAPAAQAGYRVGGLALSAGVPSRISWLCSFKILCSLGQWFSNTFYFIKLSYRPALHDHPKHVFIVIISQCLNILHIIAKSMPILMFCLGIASQADTLKHSEAHFHCRV